MDKKMLGNIALPGFVELIYELDSEGRGLKIINKDKHRVFNVLTDSETILVNSENELYLPLDNQTIFVDSETGLIKAAGLMVEAGDAIHIDNSEVDGVALATINVMYDSETIILNSEGELSIPIDNRTIIINSEGLLVAIPEPLKDGVATKVRFATPNWDSEVIDVLYDSETLRIDSENRLYVPIDKRTIIVDSENKIVVPIDETTLIVNSEGDLAVNVDFETILFNSEGKLSARSVREGEAIEITTSEGEQVINVKYDDLTIHLNDSENVLELRPDATKAFTVDSEGKLFVKADEHTIWYSSEGNLELHLNELKGLEVDSEDKLAVKVDGDTVRFNSEGELEAKTILEGIANHIYDSEGDLKIDVLFDELKGLAVDSENRLFIKLDPEKAVDFDSEGKIFIKVDDKHIFISSEGKLELHLNELKGLMVDSEDKLAVKVDDLSIKFDSEGKLYAIPEPLFDGVATKVNPKTSSYDSESIDVLFNSEAGLRVNSENELEVVLDSEALAFKDGAIQVLFDHETIVLDSEGQLSVPLDERTLVLNSEGKLIVDIDEHSLVYAANSEGVEKIRVNIDNDTIRFNSEGKLSADSLPKPLINSTFLHVSSEGEVEWRPSVLNEVELVGELNAETARLFWFGTSEEYAQLVANSELYDYTLYVVNDAAPIVAPDHNYNKLDNKPEINGVVLSGNKSLSDFGIQPVLHSGVATNLNNNKVDVQYLAGVLGVDTSNRLYADTYTTAQIDNMLASLRTIRYEATKPAVPVRNTLYYVGTSSPYHMWLYDSYGTEIDLGTSDVRTYSAGPGIAINSSNVISADLDTIINVGSTSVKAPTSAAVAAYAETKDNKVTSISAASTNEEYPSAKLLYDQLQTKIGAVAASDTSLQVLGGTTLTHKTPSDLGGADTKGTTKKIPQITYDKFGHLQKVEEKDLEVPLSSADTSLMLNASNELTHVVPTELGAGSTVGGQTVIPQITYDKFGHLQKVTGINVYPPTTSGLNGQLWVSDGVEAGAWTALSSLVRVKSETGTSTTSGSTTIVVNAPAADAGYVRIACIGAYISSTVDGVCWSVPSMTDSQVTFYANGWTGSATITAYTQWLYVRSNG